MSASVTWTGLSELHAWLRELPAELAGEGADIVERRANRAEATIGAGYPVREGDLKAGLTVTHRRSRFGARSTVKNSSKHALPYDIGSQTARRTKSGANRGTMPARPIFSQTVARERRGMHDDHKAMLVRHGLTVSGE